MSMHGCGVMRSTLESCRSPRARIVEGPLAGLVVLVFLALASLTLAGPLRGAEPSAGLPVESQTVRRICGPCHSPDADGMMSRISYQRKSPEAWQQTVKRMLRTGQAFASAEEAREIVRYLSDHHGLAPAEERMAFYRAEQRPAAEPLGDREIEGTCARCHVGAWFLTERRTAEEWALLRGMHLGYFPLAQYQAFTGPIPLPGESAPPPGDDRPRVERVLEQLARILPFDSPEWRAWSAKRSDRDLSGRWLAVGYRPGQGLISGEVTIEREGTDYRTKARLHLPDGSIDERSGKGVLYAGYSWRGRSQGSELDELREALMLADDGASLTGRFFRGAYGEVGYDFTLSRIGGDPRLVAAWPRGLFAGGEEGVLRFVGANLPQRVDADRIDLGPGIEVVGVKGREPNALELRAIVSEDAAPGFRDVTIAGATLVDAFVVYDRVDYLRVRPEEGMARLGGVSIPKQSVQFEAVGFHRGPDDEPFTDDDLELGPVAASWSLEEYYVRPGDDDVAFVGAIDDSGLFTPNVEGPNPDRHGTNNFGDVWVVAQVTPPGATLPLKGRAHLLVTVPLYAYWDLSP